MCLFLSSCVFDDSIGCLQEDEIALYGLFLLNIKLGESSCVYFLHLC